MVYGDWSKSAQISQELRVLRVSQNRCQTQSIQPVKLEASPSLWKLTIVLLLASLWRRPRVGVGLFTETRCPRTGPGGRSSCELSCSGLGGRRSHGKRAAVSQKGCRCVSSEYGGRARPRNVGKRARAQGLTRPRADSAVARTATSTALALPRATFLPSSTMSKRRVTYYYDRKCAWLLSAGDVVGLG